MEYDNDGSFIIEDFAQFIQKMLTESIIILQKDAHIKVLAIKFPIIVSNEFLKKIIIVEKMTDIIEQHIPVSDADFDNKRTVTAEIVKQIITDMILELKTRIFSELSEEGKMALFFDNKNDKFFWSFLDGRKIPNEKDILKKKTRRNK